MPRRKTQTRMVDVSAKPDTLRQARAEGRVRLTPEMMTALLEGSLPKGDPLEAARLAGIMAAKRTADLIPLCHPIPLAAVEVDLVPRAKDFTVTITSFVRTTAKTGVEMEALVAVATAALTLYDMCKPLGHNIIIESVRLLSKSGGTGGDYEAGK